MISVLTVCQQQLESELLLVKKEMRLRAEDGGRASGAVKVPGDIVGAGHRTRELFPGRDPLSVFAVTVQVTQTLDRNTSGSIALGRAVQIHLEISYVFNLNTRLSSL